MCGGVGEKRRIKGTVANVKEPFVQGKGGIQWRRRGRNGRGKSLEEKKRIELR